MMDGWMELVVYRVGLVPLSFAFVDTDELFQMVLVC